MSTSREDKRTTVSLATVVWEMAESAMGRKGFNKNFSAYVADLIRRDQEASGEAHTPLDETVTQHAQPPTQPDSPQKKPKDETFYCRMTREMKESVETEARLRGESSSVIVRKALGEYFTAKAETILKEEDAQHSAKRKAASVTNSPP